MTSSDCCPHCDAALPPTSPRFCIECGGALSGAPGTASPPRADELTDPAATVRLSNARVAQSVVGGTMKLPTSGAVPPGLWLRDDLPDPDDVVAVYAPLRAVVGGWSGLLKAGWQPGPEQPNSAGSGMATFAFDTRRVWFAPGARARGLRLHVHIRALAEADVGRTRRGFRYRSHYDPPMQVVEAWWADASGRRADAPIPRIQIMAPPRIKRVSDYDEQIGAMPPDRAVAWAREGRIHDGCVLLESSQQRTPAGRGLPLGVASSAPFLRRLLAQPRERYFVRARNPLVCAWSEWLQLQPRIQSEASGFGLDMDTDAVVEWWLDREGYDAVVLDGAEGYASYRRAVIAFRRAQIVRSANDV